MSEPDFDWDLGRQAWTGAEPVTPPVPPDGVRHSAARERWAMLAEAGFNLVAVIVIGVVAARSGGAARWLLAAAALLGAGLGAATFVSRLRLQRAVADTPGAYLALRLDQVRFRLMLARLGHIGAPLGLAIGLVIGRAPGLAMPEAALPTGLVWLLAAWLCAVALRSWGQARHWRREVERYATMLAETRD